MNETLKDAAQFHGIPVLITGGLGFIGSALERKDTVIETAAGGGQP